ncbi:MAG: translational GTPase TypA, partial [Lentisphaeria bacterium]|nr:translational GTPase TypA [Lentisphaeria bacterium]
YELTIAQPQVITKVIDGVVNEPIERLTVDVPSGAAGKVIEVVGLRKGEMFNMETGTERAFIEFYIPTRGLIGLRTKILNATAGEGIIAHVFSHYAPFKGEIPHRTAGVLISMGEGKAIPYAIDGLQQRGIFFIDPGTDTYEGMIVGEHCKEGDIEVNVQKEKKLTNIRAASSDRKMQIAPSVKHSLEEALEYIEADEYVEVTPHFIRLRKKYLTENERKKQRLAKMKS